ncbi:MAG: gamma-glutamyl-gamma-aminobutyrate hydrolase [Deltaproteobacteria bacterium CG11_big_fil_rev_8_21_14_0_20_47_16]|nr:MAG: gamma-glutamyl-gamma-aminobutyrate hydrolase [Deltaproteobacteria bacterium CG11_big_fil_rev_8_21_14_0_20_47_16]
MKRPRIAITCGPNIDKLPPYLKALEAAGAEGVVFQVGSCTAEEILSQVDGILLPGGGDIDPTLCATYHHPKVYGIDRDRDLLEKDIILLAHAQMKPLLGICRGEQVMAWAMGGEIYQDVDDEAPPKNTAKGHKYFPNEDFSIIVHTVSIAPQSHLARILGTTEVDVNSIHHQCVASVKPPLSVVGTSPDGLIEAIEDPHHPWFIGVQWHPEWLDWRSPWKMLFEDFVKACS